VDDFDRPFYVLTLPIIRLILPGGYISVAIFYVVSGYVCSIKPLKLLGAGNVADARASIASSAYRRFFRLAAPALLSTIINWFFHAIGAFDTAYTIRIPWDRFLVHQSPSFLASLKDLLRSCVEIHSSIKLIIAAYLALRWRRLVHPQKRLRS
jgi:hypothetical protein